MNPENKPIEERISDLEDWTGDFSLEGINNNVHKNTEWIESLRQDKTDMLDAIKTNIESISNYVSMIHELQSTLGIGEHYPDIKDMTSLQLLVHHATRELSEEWHEHWNELFDGWGFATRKDIAKLDSKITDWNPETFADIVKDEVRELFSERLETLEKKQDRILEHIGNQPVDKTLKEEVDEIGKVSA